MKNPELNLKKSLAHLKRDKRLASVIKKHKLGKDTWDRRPSEAFESLVRSIIYQQISGKAAQSILNKFKELFKGKNFPKPEGVLKISEGKLRSAGLSGQKVSYIIDLARKFKEGIINPKNFHLLSDEEIIEHLVQVKGIGRWTAHMFLMFTLKRPDVLPTGDLGVQKGFRKLFKLKKLPSPSDMEKLARKWEGHRTVASLYLWRIVDDR